MRHSTFHTSYQKDTGFTFHIENRSVFRDFVLDVADTLCKITGHRGCHTWFNAVWNWADVAVERQAKWPVDRDVAEAVAFVQSGPDNGTWEFLDEEDD